MSFINQGELDRENEAVSHDSNGPNSRRWTGQRRATKQEIAREEAFQNALAETYSATDGLTNLCRYGWCILCSSDDCTCKCHKDKEIWP